MSTDFNFHTTTYKQNMSSVYDPAIGDEVKRELLDYFLTYKSKCISSGSACPDKVEDAIRHLQLLLKPIENNSPRSKATNWQNNIPIYITVGLFIVIVGGSILHKITS
ncbi:hypothetical protein V8049_004432 [Vibrio vulnificus]|nr:hypothetical protein [Vibrio vulnificus]